MKTRYLILMLTLLPVFSASILIYNPNDYDLVDYQVRVYVGSYTGIFLDDSLTKPAIYCFEQENGECNSTPSNWAWVKVNISKKSFIPLYLGSGNYATEGLGIDEVREDFAYPNGTVSPDGWVVYHYYIVYPTATQEYEYYVKNEEYYGYIYSKNDYSNHARRGIINVYKDIKRIAHNVNYTLKYDLIINSLYTSYYGAYAGIVVVFFKDNGFDSIFYMHGTKCPSCPIDYIFDINGTIYRPNVTIDLGYTVGSKIHVERDIRKDYELYFGNWGNVRSMRIYLIWYGNDGPNVGNEGWINASFDNVTLVYSNKPIVIYKKVRICNPNSYNLVDFQTKIEFSELPEKFKFIDEDWIKYNYCFEQSNFECNTTPSETIWAKINVTANSCKDFFIISSDNNEAKNGDKVFDFYDDFNDGVLDTNKWQVVGLETATYEEANGSLHWDGGGTDMFAFIGNYQLQPRQIVEIIGRDYATYNPKSLRIVYYWDGDNTTDVAGAFIAADRAAYERMYLDSDSYSTYAWISAYLPDTDIYELTLKYDGGNLYLSIFDFTTQSDVITNYRYTPTTSINYVGVASNGNEAEIYWFRVRKYAGKSLEITLFDYLPSLNVTPENQSWTNQTIFINISCSDCSGIYYKVINYSEDCGYSNYNFVSSNFTQVEISNSGEWKLCVIIKGDLGENSTIYSFGPYQLDNLPPTSEISPKSGTYFIDQSFSISCNDNLSGCKATYYTVIPQGESCPTNISEYTIYTGPFTLSEGSWKVCYFSEDNVGNVESIKYEEYNITTEAGSYYYLPQLAKIISKFEVENPTIILYVSSYDNNFGVFVGNIVLLFNKNRALLLNCSNNCTVFTSKLYSFERGIVKLSCKGNITAYVSNVKILEYPATCSGRFGIVCDRCTIGLIGISGSRASS